MVIWSECQYPTEWMCHNDIEAVRTSAKGKTYSEHGIHVIHQAHDPVTDVLVEGSGSLQSSEGWMAV